MAEILDELNAAKTAAMKAKIGATGAELAATDLRLDVVRGVIGAVTYDTKEKKPRGALAVLKSEHKKRLESAEIYGKAGQKERSDREAAEAEIVAEFLPEEPKGPTELELQYFIADYIGATGLQGDLSAVGNVMGVIREEFPVFDGKLASQLVKKILA